jgi:transcriptional regulator with XRE-family HTH domain
MRVGAAVRAEMARRGVRQSHVAVAIKRSQAAVSARLSGEVEFSVSELVTVAGLLDVPVASLIPADESDQA